MTDVTTQPPADGDRDHYRMLLAVIWVEASIGAIVMVARLATRTFIARNLGWEDFWMVITWVRDRLQAADEFEPSKLIK